MEALTRIDLGNNKIVSLPAEIGCLQNLTTLDLRHNKLTTLPPDVARLENLFTLNLMHNDLTELPKELSNLTGLRFMALDGNPRLLSQFPIDVASLSTEEQATYVKDYLRNL